MRSVSARFLGAVARSHHLATLVEVLADGAVVAEINEVIGGTVTLDGKAATRGRLDLTIADDGTLGLVPDSPEALLAPYGNELRVSRGIEFADQTERVCLGIYRIEDAEINDTGESLEIRIAGLDRSARVIDARFEEPYQVAAGTNFATAILTTIQQAWPDVPNDFSATALTTPLLFVEEAEDRWAFCQGMATAIGMDLYFDGNGTLVLRPAPSGAAAVCDLIEGENGVLVRAARRWTRQGTFNRVIAAGENTGGALPAPRAVATDEEPSSPTYYFGPFGRVPRFYNSPFITTSTQAADAAAAILAKELGTTQQVSFGAVVNPALEPFDVVCIKRERAGIGKKDYIIDAISHPLGVEGAMEGSTRAVQVS
jgi:hypothetical protein